MESFWKLCIAFGAGVTSTLFGGWPILLQTLLLFVVIDYLTGLLAAGVKRNLSSRIGFHGIAKKIMIFVLVAMAHIMDKLLGGGHFFREGAITFYLCNEIISIIENSGQIGLPIPKRLRIAIEVLKKREEQKDGNNKEIDS